MVRLCRHGTFGEIALPEVLPRSGSSASFEPESIGVDAGASNAQQGRSQESTSERIQDRRYRRCLRTAVHKSHSFTLKSISASIVLLAGIVLLVGVRPDNVIGIPVGVVLVMTGVVRWARSWDDKR